MPSSNTTPWICKKFKALKPGSKYLKLNSQAITLNIVKILFTLSVSCTKHGNLMLLGLHITTTIARLRDAKSLFLCNQLHWSPAPHWGYNGHSWQLTSRLCKTNHWRCQRTEPSTVTTNIYTLSLCKWLSSSQYAKCHFGLQREAPVVWLRRSAVPIKLIIWSKLRHSHNELNRTHPCRMFQRSTQILPLLTCLQPADKWI